MENEFRQILGHDINALCMDNTQTALLSPYINDKYCFATVYNNQAAILGAESVEFEQNQGTLSFCPKPQKSCDHNENIINCGLLQSYRLIDCI